MKKQIRCNVFETNSSSVHSITIKNGKQMSGELYIAENNKVRFYYLFWRFNMSFSFYPDEVGITPDAFLSGMAEIQKNADDAKRNNIAFNLVRVYHAILEEKKTTSQYKVSKILDERIAYEKAKQKVKTFDTVLEILGLKIEEVELFCKEQMEKHDRLLRST